MKMNVTEVLVKDLEDLLSSVDTGGVSRPKNCTAVSKVAIIVAFRDREHHLGIFLRHFHPFLQRQLLDYRVFIIQMVNQQIRSLQRRHMSAIASQLVPANIKESIEVPHYWPFVKGSTGDRCFFSLTKG